MKPAVAAGENNVVSGLTATGAAYYFASEKNITIFNCKPEKYIPQNGGFCTYGVSKGKKFDGDPQYASVVDDELYVF